MQFAKSVTAAALAAAALLWVSGSMAQQSAPDGASRGDQGPRANSQGVGPEGRRPPPGGERRPFDGPPGPRDGGPDGPPGRRPGDGPPPPRPDGPGRPGEQGPPRGGRPGPPHPHFNREHEERRLEELREVDPELYELEKADADLDRATHDLAEKLRRAPREARDELQKELQAIVSKHFDVRQARRELHLVRLSEELDKLTESMKKRKEARAEIIGRRISELLGEEDSLAF